MAENTIAVPWPTAALTPEQWRRRVTDLAELAEKMIGRRDVSLQRQAEVALWWAGLCWSGFGPETIAASCRASLLLNENVVMAADPATQLAEVAERLDHVWEMAKTDPSAATAAVAPPLIDLPPSTPKRTRSRPRPAVEQVVLEPEPAALEQEQHDVDQPAAVDQLELEPTTLEPEPTRVEVPADWFSAGDLAQLLEISDTTLSRWRKAGRCGEQGPDWLQVGREFHFSPVLAEQLLEQQTQAQPTRVDAPLADPLADPARWLTTAQVAEVFGMSEPWVARARRLGVLREGRHCFRTRPGEFPSEPRRKGWRYDREPAIAALAAASGRPIPAITA